MPIDLGPIVRAIWRTTRASARRPRRFPLGESLGNGVRLSQATGAKIDVVRLFAIFHASKRINEGSDPAHGARGAEYAAELRGRLFELSDNDFKLLHRACAGHTHERTHPDITIQTCWTPIDLTWAESESRPTLAAYARTRRSRKKPSPGPMAELASASCPVFVATDWGVNAQGDAKALL